LGIGNVQNYISKPRETSGFPAPPFDYVDAGSNVIARLGEALDEAALPNRPYPMVRVMAGPTKEPLFCFL
jgi:hypothetical protein